jgi:hypothetical protein
MRATRVEVWNSTRPVSSCAFEQRQVHVDAVDHRVRVAEALAKGLAGGDATDSVSSIASCITMQSV